MAISSSSSILVAPRKRIFVSSIGIHVLVFSLRYVPSLRVDVNAMWDFPCTSGQIW